MLRIGDLTEDGKLRVGTPHLITSSDLADERYRGRPDDLVIANPALIHAPSPCIDYVIAHEICHLRHPAHDRSFFQLLNLLCPDWRTLKTRLECTES